MAQGTWTCLQFMLEHISKILEAYPITVGNYVYGQKVKCVEDRDDYDVVTVGTVCGFEYFDDDSHYDVGFFYQIKVISGVAIFRDGTVREVVGDVVERIAAKNVYSLDVTFPLVKTETKV